MPKKIDLAPVFQKWQEATDRIKELNAEVKELDKERKLQEKLLVAGIPIDGVRDGVQHLATRKVAVSYGKALAMVRDTLVAKSKAKEVDKIVEEFTSESLSHKFKAV